MSKASYDLQIKLFGELNLSVDGTSIKGVKSERLQALLAYILLHRNASLSRQQVAIHLWPEVSDTEAKGNLRRRLHELKQKLPGCDRYLNIDNKTVQWLQNGICWLDVAEFEAIVEAVRTLKRDTAAEPESLEQAAKLYQGDLLPACYDDWIVPHRDRLRQSVITILDALIPKLAEQNQLRSALSYAQQLQQIDPLYEPAYRHLMWLHIQEGDRASVLRIYHQCMTQLQDDLGVLPSPATYQLYQEILTLEDTTQTSSSSDTVVQLSAPLVEETSVEASTEQQIRVCITSDGVQLAYATTGQGYPLVKAANWLSHLEFDWKSPAWKHWWEGLSQHYSLVRYDERGCGLSDWNVPEFSFEAWVQDLETVIDTVGLERFALLGISQGAGVAIAYAIKYPEKVSHLILYGGYAQGRLKRNPTPEQIEEANVRKQLVKIGWGRDNPAFRQLFTSLFIPEGTLEQLNAFNELQKISTSPENAARFVHQFDITDVCALARQIQVPTLVLHAQHEVEIPFDQGRLLAALIPDAQLVPLDSKNHILLEYEPAWQRFLNEVKNFIQPNI